MLWVILILAFVFLALLSAGLYVVSAPLSAYIEFRSRPREEMAWCHKHGHFRKQYILQMGVAEVCPMCYLAAIQTAEQSANGKVTLFR